LIPDDLEGITHLFSPGVFDSWTFEGDLVAATGASAHLVECNEPPPGCPFPVERALLGGFTDGHRLGIDHWIESHAAVGEGDWILQMDIEGGEYEVINGMSQHHLAQFRIMVIEVHRLELLADAAWHDFVFRPFLEKLLTELVPIHLHANNAAGMVNIHGTGVPKLLEITLLRRDRLPVTTTPARLPHHLDTPNLPGVPDLRLRWPCAWSAN